MVRREALVGPADCARHRFREREARVEQPHGAALARSSDPASDPLGERSPRGGGAIACDEPLDAAENAAAADALVRGVTQSASAVSPAGTNTPWSSASAKVSNAASASSTRGECALESMNWPRPARAERAQAFSGDQGLIGSD